MDSKTERLNALFEEWKRSYKEPDLAFAEDGIINENEWNEAPRKVLFLLKETNKYAGNFRELAQKSPWRVPGYWAYGLQNLQRGHIPPFAEAKEKYGEAFCRSALVNLKKITGGSAAKDEKIKGAARDDAKYIIKELEIIAPEIVVCGSTFWIVREVLLPGDFEPIGPVPEMCFMRKNVLWIDYCHPGARCCHDTMYYGLVMMYQNCLPFVQK